MKMDGMFEEGMERKEMHHSMYGSKDNRQGKHKAMTMEEVGEHLSKDLPDEIEDSKKYLHMAKIAGKYGDDSDCHYLTEIAKDEFTHAYFIHSFMKEHDIDIPREQEEAFKELKETFEELFR